MLTTFIFLFGLALVAAGLFIWRMGSVTPSWRQVDATILSSMVATDSDGGFLPQISYRYSIDGREFESSHFSIVSEFGSRQYAQAMVERFPPNSHTIAFVNPERQEEAVLEPGRQHGPAIMWVFIGSCVSAYGIYRVLAAAGVL